MAMTMTIPHLILRAYDNLLSLLLSLNTKTQPRGFVISLFIDEEAEAQREYDLPKVTCNSYKVTAGWELRSA